MKDIVARYLTEGSNVYGCLVDASKAFDKIHFVCHLGNNINFNLEDALDIQMKKASFIGSVNNLMSHLGNIPAILLNDLFLLLCLLRKPSVEFTRQPFTKIFYNV